MSVSTLRSQIGRLSKDLAHVTSPARTVVDCFRYRNKVGLDVALEALRDCYRLQLATVDELWQCAGRLRAANVMRPYLESLQ